jgi:hypothetical protein
LSIVIVTLPALAESDDLSNLRLPLGSAARLSCVPPDEEPPDDAGAGVVLAGVVFAEVLPPPPPHPAAARAATAAPRTSNFGMRINGLPPDRVPG